VNVTASPMSLGDLVERGAGDLARYLDRERVPATPLEWLGIAVARVPALAGSARTADDVGGRARPGAESARTRMFDALTRELGVSAGIVDQARRRLLERHPGAGEGDNGPEIYAELVEAANRNTLRLSEPMVAAYASFLGGAIEAAGGLADAEDEQVAELRATQLHAALGNTLGGLLAYARLIDRD
jgi:hypothetical protein